MPKFDVLNTLVKNMAKTRLPTYRALDIGFGFTKFTREHTHSGQRVDVKHFPSYASLLTGPSFEGQGNSMDVVVIEVNGVKYQVGADAKTVASGSGRQILEDSFFLTDQYIALARGALTYMKVPEDGIIDVLTMGLPLTVMNDRNIVQHLTKVMQDAHTVPSDDAGGTRVINVRKIYLIPQVMGSLIALSEPAGILDEVKTQKNLTIDVGYGTLLWLTSDGLKPIGSRSGGNMGGVSSLLQAMIQEMNPKAVSHIAILDRLDKALLYGEPSIKISGEVFKIDDYRHLLKSAIKEHLTELTRRCGGTLDIGNVFLTGGGSYLYREAVSQLMPKGLIHANNDGSQYSNVIGFQILAERYA
jgi:plasmid segregation protein ParM